MTIADFKGDVVLVNLWATWCRPCVAELPSLDRLQARLRDKGFKVVALNVERSPRPSKVRNFLEKRGIRGLAIYWDKLRQIPEKWPYEGIPTSYLLDREGKVARVFNGPAEWNKGEAFDAISALLK